ncbi:MAG: hypothetical protein LC775_12780 [Acidobacteria bacterium]|nr:hypothetical protein [Acidobacteriota bacterium]
MSHVRKLVKPDRDLLPYKRRVRENWWKYEHQAKPLYEAISKMDRVIALTIHTKTVIPLLVNSGLVFSHGIVVFATNDTVMLALLSSAPHYWWAKSRGSSMKTDLRLHAIRCVRDFPMPELTLEMRELGNRLDAFRRDVMMPRDSGLTKTYNLVFDPACTNEDIEELRRIHREIDAATIRAYGWEHRIEAVGGLDHGFHKVGRETRYTIGPDAQREILDSLLELNHERYAQEVAQGLHNKKKSARRSAGQQEMLL